MNEKIREELMYHSGLVADGCWNELDEYDRQAILRFGELIVKECIDVADNTVTGESTYGWLVANQIKQHFGVE